MVTHRPLFGAEFSRAEYDRRYRRAWALMRKAGLSGLLVTSQSNHRYLTGHRSQFWASNARPMYTILPDGKPPVSVVTEVEGNGLRATSYVRDIRTFAGFADDSVPVLAEVLQELGFAGAKVGVDFGDEMRLGMPLTSFRKLEARVKRIKFVDGSPVLWALRLIKSAPEIAYIRQACRAANAGIRRGWKILKPGMTARAVHRHMVVAMMEAGADRVAWSPVVAGRENNDKYTLEPTNRKFRAGDAVWTDIGVAVNGYWSDFSRVAAVGCASSVQRDDYRRVWDVTQACIEAVRPGLPVSHIAKVRDREFVRIGYRHGSVNPGRMGHGSGLDMTEPPSIAAFDGTMMKPGLVLHIEPKIVRDHGIFQLEELVAVTKTGYAWITEPAPKTLPVIGK